MAPSVLNASPPRLSMMLAGRADGPDAQVYSMEKAIDMEKGLANLALAVRATDAG